MLQVGSIDLAICMVSSEGFFFGGELWELFQVCMGSSVSLALVELHLGDVDDEVLGLVWFSDDRVPISPIWELILRINT